MRKILILSLIFPLLSLASSMDDAYQAGLSFAHTNDATIQATAKNPEFNQVPHYQGANVPEAGLAGDLDEQARLQMRTDPTNIGNVVNASIKNNHAIPAKSNLIDQTNRLQNQAAQTQSVLYCQDDTCTDTSYTKTSQATFATDASALSALDEAGKDLDDKAYQSRAWMLEHKILIGIKTFKGDALKCRNMMLSYDNCCDDSGWGQKIGLAGCNQEEKTLGKDKEKKLCHSLGEYCAHKTDITHVCTEHKKTYCCFDSILARIIQEQGRVQLGMTFGTPDEPNCSGLTPVQLQKIDFSKINFTEFYTSLGAKMHVPSASDVQQQLQDDMQQMYGQGVS